MTESRVKILHVTFNMGIGGTEQVIRQIIENSDAGRFVHEVLCIDGSIGPLGQVLIEKGIHVEKAMRQPGTDFKLLLHIWKLIKRRKIDVIHCHQYTPYFYGVVSAFGTSASVIFTEHGRFYPDRHNFKRRIVNPILAFGTSYITAISKSTRDAVAKYEYMPRNKIQVIYNGIKEISLDEALQDKLLSRLGLSPDYRYIGTISRLEPIKNQKMMINAFFEVKKKIPKVRLVIIGDGAKMQELKKLAESLDLQEDVIFTGFINDPQIYIQLFELFLLSSFSEGTSMTVLEAMSLSKPCVVTDVGGNPEVVENERTGMISPSDDVDSFSKGIIKLLMDDIKRSAFGSAAKEKYLKEFTVDRMVESYYLLYQGK